MAITYEPIATYTVSGSSTNTYTFSSIPSTYTDIICIINPAGTSSGFTMYCRYNGDTGSNYSGTFLYGSGGSGTTPVSGNQSNQTRLQIDIGGVTANFDSNYIFHILNYSNATTYKSSLVRSNENGFVGSWAGLWRSTSAINSITLYTSANNFASGSTITLYGIKAA